MYINVHLLSERLAPLGIMGPQLRAVLKPLNTIVLRYTGVSGDVPNRAHTIAQSRQSLGFTASCFHAGDTSRAFPQPGLNCVVVFAAKIARDTRDPKAKEKHSNAATSVCTHGEIFAGIALNQSDIRLYLPFPDRFSTKRNSVLY